MKKLIAICTLLLSVNTYASMITVQLDNTDVNVGDAVQVSLLATDFASFDTFDFDLDFDTSLFSYDAASLSSDLLAIPPLIFDVNQVAEGMAFSFLDFASFAGGDFLLAEFSLTALAGGSTDFSINDGLFSEFDFNTFENVEFNVDVSQAVTASVNASAVPEPSSMALFALAGLALAGFRRKV